MHASAVARVRGAQLMDARWCACLMDALHWLQGGHPRGVHSSCRLLLVAVLLSRLRPQHGAPTPGTIDWGPTAHVCNISIRIYNGTWIQNPQNGHRCPEQATCCPTTYSSDQVGCCPYADGVCCGYANMSSHANTVMACCPKAHTCVFSSPYDPWEASTHPQIATCVPDGDARTEIEVQLPNSTGIYPCKPGATLPPQPPAGKSVLVIGDSVSLGWTPALADLLKAEAMVQHSPGGGDGGAEETAYGLQCLDYFLRSPNGTMNVPDVLIFNWGLHDGVYLGPFPWTGPGTYHWPGPGNMTIPGQEGPEWLYSTQLSQITQQLVAWAAAHNGRTKLLFALTSPMICNKTSDDDVAWLNVQATTIMARFDVPIVDLRAPIIGKCGPPPQPTCFGLADGFCPHCIGGNQTEDGVYFATPNATFGGYAWLARTAIAPTVRALLGG